MHRMLNIFAASLKETREKPEDTINTFEPTTHKLKI